MKDQSSYQLLPEMELFADTYKRDNEAPMKYLYHSDDMNDIKETIAKMTFVCILQNEARINPDNVMQLAMATMFESACPVLKRYAAFTAWINPNFTEKDYYDIYNEAFKYYYDHAKNLMEEFAEDGELWTQGFEGTLFID